MLCSALQCGSPVAAASRLHKTNNAARPCHSAGRSLSFAGRRMLVVRAADDGDKPAEDETAAQEEARIASLEKATKQKRRGPVPPQMRMQQPQGRKKGNWREGELFPYGWEEMGALEKGWQLWAGERGFLFWSNKLALYAICVLAGGWILFRFVGPALGLYTLTNDLLTPPVE